MAAMRFMHMGREAHVVGEATAPSIRAGDGLVIVSGSGETAVSVNFARIAKGGERRGHPHHAQAGKHARPDRRRRSCRSGREDATIRRQPVRAGEPHHPRRHCPRARAQHSRRASPHASSPREFAMSALKPVVTIGDGLIDAVETSDAPPALYPGGAALNLAVGLARLNVPSVLAARIGLDRNGFRLMRYLREEGVRLINTPNADFTSVATSRRRGGEPSYDFTPSTYRRRIAFNSTLLKAIAEAPVVAVNSFSYAAARQADALCEALDARPGLEDPRPEFASEVDRRSRRLSERVRARRFEARPSSSSATRMQGCSMAARMME